MTRANGGSLLRGVGNRHRANYQYPADDIPSFTLGSVYVSPMSMAAAYATVAAEGRYCTPIAISKIVTSTGRQLPVQSADCHRAFSRQVAYAANYILQAVLVSGTAGNRGIGIPAAAKTGTANSGYYAAFAGWTPRLAGYVSVFNPIDPTSPARPDARRGVLLSRGCRGRGLPRPDVRRQRAGGHLAGDVPAPAAGAGPPAFPLAH